MDLLAQECIVYFDEVSPSTDEDEEDDDDAAADDDDDDAAAPSSFCDKTENSCLAGSIKSFDQTPNLAFNAPT